MAQLILPVAGAAIGFMVGGPAGAQAGWMLGSLGSSLMAPSQPKPAVGSLAPTEVEYGWPIPRIRGTRRVTAWRLHQSTLEPVAQRQETKGSSSRTVGYRYRCNIGLLICRRGPTQMVRIWRNKELVAAFRTDAEWEQIAASVAGVHWESATFYDGAADQLPHPQYEADKAPRVVPAYRGWCTLWLDGAWCDGRSPPAIEIEVTTGPEESLGVSIWQLRSQHVGSFNREPGSPGYLFPGEVPYKVPDRFTYSTPTGYTGSVFYGSDFDRETVAVDDAVGYIVSTGEVLIGGISTSSGGSTYADGGVVETYIAAGTVQVIATGDYHIDQYPYQISYLEPLTTFLSSIPGQYRKATVHLDASDPGGYGIRSGASDVPLVAVAYDDGTRIETAFGSGSGDYIHPLGYAHMRYVVREGSVYLGALSDGVMVARYSAGGGTPTVTNLISPTGAVSGMACDGEILYVASGGTIYQLNADDLTSAGASFSSTSSLIFCNSAGNLYHYDSGVVRQRVGGAWVEVLDVSGGLFSEAAMVHPPMFENGVLYAVQEMDAEDGFVAWQGIASLPVVTPNGTTINAILDNYWRACGIPAAQIDLSETAGLTVFGHTAAGSGKYVTDELAGSHFFDIINDGIGLKTIARGGASVATIPWAHTGVGVGDAKEEPQEADPRSPVETPRRVSISGANGDADHEVSTQTDDHILGQNAQTDSRSLAISTTPAHLKGIANTIAADQKTGANSLKFTVGTRWLNLELADVVTVLGAAGESRRVRLVRESFMDWVRDFDSVHDRAADIQLVGVVTEAGANEPTLTIQTPGSAEAIVVDGPMARDQDNVPGVYVAVDLQGGAGFAGVFHSPTESGTFEQAAQVNAEARVGTLLTVLGAWDGKYQWDHYQSVDVLMAESATLTSTTPGAMASDASLNWALIGSEARGWEAVRFLDPTLIATDTYRITKFLRARRGTETLAYTHIPGERFIVIDSALRSAALNSASVGEHWWEVVAAEQSSNLVSPRRVDFAAIRTKPLSPHFMRGERDAAGNLTIRWTPRTRFATRWNGAIYPNSEGVESYRVEVFAAGVFGTVVHSVVVGESELAYSAAQQTSDGVINPARIAVRVRAIGPTGQLGYPLEEVV